MVQLYLSNKANVVFCNGFWPLLFFILINDLLIIIICSTSTYCYDIKNYKRILTFEDVSSLQNSINKMVSCCAKNSLRLNLEECAFVPCISKQHFIFSYYDINNVLLNPKKTIKNPDVFFNDKLNWKNLLQEIYSASKLLGLVIR